MHKLRYIDALRGWAILGVLVVHCSQIGITKYPFILMNFLNSGAMGVQLFYIVSAFTLCLSFNQRKGIEKNEMSNFFIRRFFRIAPLYYLAILYYIYQDGLGPRYWLGDMHYVSFYNIASNFLFMHGFNPYWINSIVPGGWSISIEMIFYCFFPLLVKSITNINRALVFFIMTMILKLLLDILFLARPQISDLNLWNNYLYFYLPSQLPVFALGFILYYLYAEKNTMNIKNILLKYAAIVIIIQSAISFNSNHIIFACFFTLLGWALSNDNSKLVNSVTIYFGKISFSMYLSHFAVLHWMQKYNFVQFFNNQSTRYVLLNFIFRMLLLLLSSTIISTILFHLIEKPFQKIGKNIIGYLS